MAQMSVATPSRCMRCGWATIQGDQVCRYCGAHLAYAASGLPAVALAAPREGRLPHRALRAARRSLFRR
jgi:predicted amidophosphoribosyltransferase